ncbi:MAG: hypothetical protein O3A00_02950 [Planctomycetota bacterium]|nr:hypothetical protein [Planctomycetota bacterium]
MGINRKIEFEKAENLYLDPLNPRLGRRNVSPTTAQSAILDQMKDWTLDELAISFIENGFWTQEALIVIQEELYGQERLVVVEGNRRLAALKFLKDATEGRSPSRRWDEIVASVGKIDPTLFSKVPLIRADHRDDVTAFLGFRHVTGIKQWNPAEKAEYIARLIDEKGMSYQEVMRKIGSKTEPVRRNYIAYRVLLQLEDLDEEVSLEHIEEKFSVLFLSLRESGIQRFLNINIRAEPEEAKQPIPEDKFPNLVDFAKWMFGTNTDEPLFTDSRNVGRFATVLGSREAVAYLRSTDDPDFEMAVRKAGADEQELVERVQRATDEIEQTLSRVHLYVNSTELKNVVVRFGKGSLELLKKFPDIHDELVGGSG